MAEFKDGRDSGDFRNSRYVCMYVHRPLDSGEP